MATLRTKADLISFIQSKVYQNTSNAVTGQMAQDAMLDMVEAIFGGDLASTSEVLTGEIYNGKPVYAQTKNGNIASLQGNSTQIIPVLTNYAYQEIDWAAIDYSNSYYTGNNQSQSFTLGSNNLIVLSLGKDTDTVCVSLNNIAVTTATNVVYSISIKYTTP